MKNFKRIASLVLALTMVLCMGISAFAATITIAADDNSPVTGHTYEVYQIFTGKLDGTILTNIKYGANYTPGEATTDTLVPKTELDAIGTTEADAKAFADNLMNTADGNTVDIEGAAIATLDSENGYSVSKITVQGDNPATEVDETSYEVDLPDGYYLIVDKGGNISEGDALSAYIVQVIKTKTINPKSETISSDKVITGDDYNDNNGSDDSIADGGKTSNGAVGSTVNFTLTVKVPENAEGYSYYYCVLNDTLSEGLTFNPASVVVKVGDDILSSNTDENTEANDYALYTGDDADGKTFQIAMLDAKSLAGQTITVTYSATINKNAKVGVEGNYNKYTTVYSNKPEYDYDDKNDNGKPDAPDADEGTDIPTGVTPEKETRTYVTGVKLIKVDEEGNVLTGAEFEITGESVKYVLTSEETFTQDADGEYWKLNGDRYTTEEPRTADVMEEQTDRSKGGYVGSSDDTRELITVGDKTYAAANSTELADTNTIVYKLLKANSSSYVDTTTKYKKTITYNVKSDADTEDTQTFVGADGVVYFSGLGEGTYTIKETTTPAGYNTIPDITLNINWEAPESWGTTEESKECTWTATASNVTGELTLNDKGVFEIEVENVSGSNLPETGGIGTTIFYISGAVLLLGAAVLLITKRRMNVGE